MLVFVVAAFAADQTPQRPREAVAEMLAEMLFADLEQVTNRIDKLESAIRKPIADREEHKRELDLMLRLRQALEAELPIAGIAATDAETKLLRGFAFLSQKPSLVVLNCSENSAAEGGPAEIESRPCIQLSAKIEEELAQLDPGERGEFLADLHLAAPARDRLIRLCCKALDLVSFLTFSGQECRAWSLRRGTAAVDAAGEVHTDMARGFIRAEVVAYDDLRSAGDMKAARAAGKVRLEGKTYTVQDGDVSTFRFNV
jgi:ribosome-binding ATPase YchF (GTP1/OBG family)